MARKIKVDGTQIVESAIDIIEQYGYSAVSARTIADRLGISTQPIYREFGDMDGLMKAVLKRGLEIFAEYISGAALDQAVAYVRFAGEHCGLFDFLFRRQRYEYSGLDELSRSLMDGTDIIERLQSLSGLPRERVYRLHLYVWMAIHGLAVISADNYVKLETDELKNFTKELTRALTLYYKTVSEGGEK